MLFESEKLNSFYLNNRKYIRISCLAVILLSYIFIMFTSEIRYKSERVLIPSQQKSSLGIAEGIAGATFFSGLTGDTGSTDSEKFKLMLFSNEISKILYDDDFVRNSLLSDYLTKSGNYVYKWSIKDYFTSFFLALRNVKYDPILDERFISDHLRERIYLSENRENNVLSIDYFGDTPDFSEYLLEKLVNITLSKISEQKKSSADKKMSYLEEKIAISTNNSVKNSLANAYESELKIKMNADLNIEIYEVVKSSKQPYLPSSPNFFIYSFIFILFAATFVIIENYLFNLKFSKKEKQESSS